MVIGYKVSWLTAEIMKRKKLQPWVGLPNILCREFVVPELLQHNAPPARWPMPSKPGSKTRRPFRP